jgi:hypothetical protein
MMGLEQVLGNVGQQCIPPVAHFRRSPISNVISNSFADFFVLLHLQSCFKRLTLFWSMRRLDSFLSINKIIVVACTAFDMS